jgi:hypothetical protein
VKKQIILFSVVFAIVAVFGYVNFLVLVEYYGAGSPYYGRSVNMDKWKNPLPFLAFINVLLFAVIGLILKVFKRR